MLTSRRLVRFSVLGLLLAACATEANDDADTGEDQLIGNFRSPDANNPWTRGVDLSQMTIGEETVLPNEAQMFDGFARDIEGMQDRLEVVNGRKERAFHAKGHGCVQGELRVHVPASLANARVGLFAEDKTYPTWVRYSNGTGFVQADKRGDVRGVAIKVMKVGGSKLLGEGATQDFLMTNGATTPAPDSQAFVAFGKALTDARVSEGGEEVGTIEGMLRVGGYLFKPENKRVREYLIAKAIPRVATKGSLLGEQFWTGGAIAMGVEAGDPMHAKAKQAAKLTAIAGVLREDGQCKPVRDLPNPFNKDYFRKDLRERMLQTETCLDIQIQFQKDPAKQPMEDTSVEWTERDSPFISIATVVLPKTNLEDAATGRAENFCNGLGFTPWHSMPEHRPLGNIQRARLKVYEASRTHRGGAAEPTGDERF